MSDKSRSCGKANEQILIHIPLTLLLFKCVHFTSTLHILQINTSPDTDLKAFCFQYLSPSTAPKAKKKKKTQSEALNYRVINNAFISGKKTKQKTKSGMVWVVIYLFLFVPAFIAICSLNH